MTDFTIPRRSYSRAQQGSPATRTRLLLCLLIVLVSASGCGGGSSGSKSSKSTLRERAIASVRLTRGTFAIAGIGRMFTRAVHSERPRLKSILAAARRTRDAQPDLDPDLGLYFVVQTDLDGSGHEDLFADASHQTPTGAFVWMAPVWANGQKDTYPAAIHTDYHVDGGQFSGEHGAIDFVANDVSGENGTMHVVMTTRENERVEADFDIVNGKVKGREKCTLPDDTSYVVLDNWQDGGGMTSTIQFDDGASETVTTQPDGSMFETLNGPDGSMDVSGSLDENGIDTLVFDDGSQETVDVDTADAGDGGGSGDDGNSSSDDGSGKSIKTRRVTVTPLRRK